MSEEAFEIEVPNVSEEIQQKLEDATSDKKIRSLRYLAKETAEYLNVVREQVKDVENFWPFAILSHLILKQAISVKADRQAFSYLTNVELLQDVNDPRPYELVFHFKENPYFKNSTLSKKYSLPATLSKAPEDGSITNEMRGFEHEDLVESSIKIDWKDNLCQKYPRRKADGASGEFDGDFGSFFHYFTETADPFSLGTVLQQDILPDIYDYFRGVGEACDEGDDFEDDDDEEDELDDEDEDEIDLEDPKPKKKQKTN